MGDSSFLGTGYIPESVLIEIFLRLPTKSVFKFKCVCKQWLSLISDPSFVRFCLSQVSWKSKQWVFVHDCVRVSDSYDLNSLCDNALLVDSYSSVMKSQNSPKISILTFPSSQLHLLNSRIVASSNGLFLCRQSAQSLYFYYVVNPVTRNCTVLPSPLSTSKGVQEGFLVKVQECVVTSYKVVRLIEGCCETNVLKFEIFSSESGEWKNVTVNSPLPISLNGKIVVGCNGVLHWFDREKGIVVTYDPCGSTNELCITSFPSSRESSSCVVSWWYDEFQGRLRYVEVTGFLHPTLVNFNLNVWTLEDYATGNWTLEHKIGKTDLVLDAALENHTLVISPRAFHPSDSNIIYFLGSNNFLISYDIRTRKLEVVEEGGKKYFCGFFSAVLPPWPIVVPSPCWTEI